MNVQGWWDFTREALQTEQWLVAEGALRRLLELAPAHPELLDLLSHTLLMQGRYSEAESILLSVLREGGNNFWTPHKLGDALRGQHRLSEAVAAYEQALNMGSTSPLTPRNLLQVLDQLNAARAIEQLERWHQQADFCQSTEPEPWQIGACDAALLSAGPELANWLISKGCDNTKIRSMAIREAAANLDIETSLALAKLGEGSLKLRLIKLLKLS